MYLLDRNFPQTSEIPSRSYGQVYSSIKNPVIAVIKRAADTQVTSETAALESSVGLIRLI